MHNAELLPFIPLFYILIFIGTFALISRYTGWSALAEKYRDDSAQPGLDWQTFCSARMRGLGGYNHCIWAASAPDGFHLKTGPWLFARPFHPPLRFPWSAIQSITHERRVWCDGRRITLRGTDVSIWIEERAFKGAESFLPST